jgi:hypothetical protein
VSPQPSPGGTSGAPPLKSTAVGLEGWLTGGSVVAWLADGPATALLELRSSHVSSVIRGRKQNLCLLTRFLSAPTRCFAGSNSFAALRVEKPGCFRRSSAVILQLPVHVAYTSTKGREPLTWETVTSLKHCLKSSRSKTACVSAADATGFSIFVKTIDPAGADGAHRVKGSRGGVRSKATTQRK